MARDRWALRRLRAAVRMASWSHASLTHAACPRTRADGALIGSAHHQRQIRMVRVLLDLPASSLGKVADEGSIVARRAYPHRAARGERVAVLWACWA